MAQSMDTQSDMLMSVRLTDASTGSQMLIRWGFQVKLIFGEKKYVREARKFLWGLIVEIMAECKAHPETRERHAIGRMMMVGL